LKRKKNLLNRTLGDFTKNKLKKTNVSHSTFHSVILSGFPKENAKK